MTTNQHIAVPTAAVPILPKVRKERLYTLQEYLRKEEKSEKKHFFLNGKIVEMPGGTPNHSYIAANLIGELKIAFRAKKDLSNQYVLGTSDLQIWIPAKNSVMYPDAVVIAAPPLYHEDNDNLLINPLVVIEVLSPSTRQYDKGDKSYYYKTLPSLMEYILVEPNEATIITSFQKETEVWETRIVRGLENSLHLRSIGIEIPLSGIYEHVKFENGKV